MTKERWILFSLGMCMFLASLGTSITNVALPILSEAFQVTFDDVRWVVVAYLVANGFSIVLVGKIGDLLGRRKVLLIGILLFSLSAFICGVSTSFFMLIIARILQGIAAAILMALSVAQVSEFISKGKVGRTMEMLGTASAIGTASGPAVGGFILESLRWNAIYYLMGFLGIICFIVSYCAFPKSFKSTEIIRPTLVETFKKLNLISNLVMNICVSAVMMSTLIVGPFFLNKTLGLSAASVGLIMTVGPVVSIISGIPAGRIADKMGPSKIIIFGLSQMLIGTICFVFLPKAFGVIGYIISTAVLSPGYQMFQAGNNSSVMMNVHDHQRGVVSGILSLSRNLGLILGASLAGGLEQTFLMGSVFILLALFLSGMTRPSC